MQRAFLGMSHTPLLGLNPLPVDVDVELHSAIGDAAKQIRAWAPELIVLLGPDHYNGFVNELMPTFCVGTEAVAVGDYESLAGALNVEAAAALGLLDHLMEDGFDPAVSRRMRVDHGFSQVLELLWGGLDTPPLVPVFMNAVAPPSIMRLKRCVPLGQSLGRFLDRLGRRTLVIGSGGLSHEPPVPGIDHPDPAIRERIIVRSVITPEQKAEKTKRVMAAGLAFAAGQAPIKPLNAAWDRRWMQCLREGNLEILSALDDAAIGTEAGLSAHESKAWLVARAAMPSVPLQCGLSYYRSIPELIAGFGILFMHS